jgi:cell division protein FtsI (penicillin-binding protein 3)
MPAKGDLVTLSKMSYGYSVELSPMQILTFYNGIANNGKMIRPILVKSIQREGEDIKTFSTETIKSSLCRKQTLEDIRLALHDVVWDNHLGTASVNPWGYRKAQSELVHIAGKTGTAQLFYKGHYRKDMHRMTFVGYFPEEAPEYTCICMIERPRNNGAYDAGMDCGTVVRQIAEKTMAYAGVYVLKNGELIFKKK